MSTHCTSSLPRACVSWMCVCSCQVHCRQTLLHLQALTVWRCIFPLSCCFDHTFSVSPPVGRVRIARDQPIFPPVYDLHLGIADWINKPVPYRLSVKKWCSCPHVISDENKANHSQERKFLGENDHVGSRTLDSARTGLHMYHMPLGPSAHACAF